MKRKDSKVGITRYDIKSDDDRVVYDDVIHPRQAYLLSLLFGANREQICRVLDITTDQFGNWRKKHARFRDALKDGADGADARVAEALFNCIVGYSVEEDVAELRHNRVIRYKVKKNFQPNGWLALKWLYARQRSNWNVASKVDVNTKITKQITMDDISDEELKSLEKIGLKIAANVRNN